MAPRREPSTRFNPKLIALAIALVCIALVLVSLVRLPTGKGTSRTGTPATSALRTIPLTDVNPYGANFYLHREVEAWKVDKTVKMAADAGIGWLKQHFPWEEIESSKGKYLDEQQNSTWQKYDAIVSTAEKYGLRVIARLDRPPGWTRGDNSLREAPPDSLDDYADFVRTVVKRYKGRINYYQIWNEPNIYPEWGNRPVNPAEYVALLKAGYTAAKEADPNVVILSAPLAQTLDRSERNLSDIEYLRGLYANGFKAYYDVLLANAYGFSSPPEAPPDPDVLNFSRFLLLRQIMEENGDGGKPVWFNEFGWNASPNFIDESALFWGRVSEEQQAEYTVRAIQQTRGRYDWAGVFCIWYFRQDGHIRQDSAEYYFRMVDPGFTPRPVHNAVGEAAQYVTVATRGAYQETNPAAAYQGQWQLVLDPLASGGTMMMSRGALDNATIRFAGSALALAVRKSPDAGAFYVAIDGREVNLLPKDSLGRSVLDLYAEQTEWHSEVPVVDGLAPGEHTLRLLVASPSRSATAEGACVLDGFVVRGDSASGTNWLVLALSSAAAVAAVVGAFIWRRRRAAAAT